MAKAKQAMNITADDALLESLESARLREALSNFSTVRSPAHAVAVMAIFRADKILTAKIRSALHPLDLTPERYELLGALMYTRGGRMSLKKLGKAVMIHPATTTYTVDILEKRGLIRRTADPNDRRGILAQITPAGRDAVRRAVKKLELIDWGIEELADDEAAAVARVLSRLKPV